jgi:two-component system, chemotaxis family, chemotaxis protein CheY
LEICGIIGMVDKMCRSETVMRPRVLVVDDSKLMRHLVSEALVRDGWEVVGEAGDGDEALEKYQQTRPDAVTLDITMPGCDGLHAIGNLLAIDPKAKVVVVSALNQTKLVAQAIRAGAQAFVAKPFLPGQLQETMRTVMEEPARAECIVEK